MKKPIQVFEYEVLKANDLSFFSSEKQGKKVIDKLWQFNDANNNIYFNAVRNGVKFKNYVGVIQIGNITIEILPKADKQSTSIKDKENWHKALLKMLAISKRIRIDTVSEASLKKRYHSLLDLYFEIFIKEVNYLLEHGLIKEYRRNNANLTALKGKLNFNKNIQHNLIHKERFYTSHQVYDYNHLINQILYKALLALKSIATNSTLIDSINRTLSHFPEVKDIPINKTHFNRLKSSRKSTKYKDAIQIAKMILLNYSPDIKGGNEHMIALLFDMNKLWEAYIYRMLLRNKDDSISVSFQNKQKFWENRNIKPDLVIKKEVDNQEEIFIIDTKWKLLDYTNPKPSDDDLKQMFAYNLYWNAKRSMLLYPNSNEINESFGRYWKGRNSEYENMCKIGFINVLDKSKQLNMNIGKEIINKLI